MTNEFIEKALLVHGSKYDYSEVLYVTAKTKVNIICTTHGQFAQTPNAHLCGNGCPKCVGRYTHGPERLAEWIKKAQLKHGHQYDYSLITAIPTVWSTKIPVICSVHGVFQCYPNHHVSSQYQYGCPKCGKQSAHNKQMLGLDQFIEKSIATHGAIYDYSQVVYQGAHKLVSISCSIHGSFKVSPANHWSNGVGCPGCMHSNPSKGEARIGNWLTQHKIPFECQKQFPGLFYKSNRGRLRYDFYLPAHNVLIEYDGEQHFMPIRFSSLKDPDQQLLDIQARDQLKTEYALQHGHNLLRIKYDADLEQILADRFICMT